MKTAHKVSLNSLSNVLALISGNFVSLVTLPTFLMAYGDDQYGVYILALGVTTTLALFDLGINTSLTKFTAEYIEDSDAHRYSTAFLGSILLSGVLGLLFGTAIFGLSFVVEDVFNVPQEHAATAEKVFRLAGLYTFIYVFSRVPQSILEGHQLFYYRNLSKLATIAATLLAFVFVRFEPLGYRLGFTQFVLWMMAAQLIPGAINCLFIMNKQLLKGVSWRSGLNREILFSEFARFSGNLFLLELIGIFAFQTDKLIVGAILTPALVTILTVVTKPMFIARMVNNQTLLVFGPLFAQRNRNKNDALTTEILRRGNLIMSVIMLPIVALLIILIQPFIDLYIGGEHSRYAYWGGIAGLIYLFTPFSGLVQRHMVYTDQVKAVRNISFWLVLANVTVSVVGTFYFGIGGVILGSLVQAVLAVPAYNLLFKTSRDIQLSKIYSRWMLINLMYIVGVASALFCFVQWFGITTWWHFVFVSLASSLLLFGFGAVVIYRNRLWVSPKTTAMSTTAS